MIKKNQVVTPFKLSWPLGEGPGADPRQIRLAYRGIEGLSVSDTGDLILRTTSGELRDGRPVAYQEIEGRRVAVEGGFRVEGTGSAAAVHPALGGAARLAALHEVDEGSRHGPDLPLKTGYTSSSDFPTTAGAFDTNYNPDQLGPGPLHGQDHRHPHGVGEL